jgi:putative ABC transport system permease protein
MRSLLQDARLALRSLARLPGFTALALLTLALGIGANVAVFSVVDGVLLAPLSFPRQDRLVRLFQAYPARGVDRGSVSELDAGDWGARGHSLASVGVYSTLPSGLVLLGKDEPREVPTAYVSAGFFAALATPPALGRALAPRDVDDGAHVVVASHGFWSRQLGADPGAVGGTLTLDGEPYLLAGVMPEGFRFPASDVELWAPLTVIPESSIPRLRFVRWLGAVGRLAPGATVEAARAELRGIAAALAQEYPDSNDGAAAVTVVPLKDQVVGAVRPALLGLSAAVGLVLLIACANVSNLLLARGLARQREVAVRAALGAGRWRLVRQMLVESTVLSLAGGALGLLVAVWGVPALLRLGRAGLPRAAEVGFDAPVLAFAFAAALATVLVSGLAPAVRLSRTALVGGLKEASPGAGVSASHSLLRQSLVAAEVGLAVLLLSGAGLVVRSLVNMVDVDPGFDPSRLLAVSLTAPDYKYPERPGYLGIYRAAMEKLASLPGVESVASIKSLPLRDPAESFSFTIAGRPTPSVAERPTADMFPVSPGLFHTLGVPLLAGRDFDAHDDAGAPLVAIVNETAARRYWPGEDPAGQRLGAGDRFAEVVGVVGDVKYEDLVSAPEPAVFLPQEQVPRRVFSLLVRTAGDPLALAAAARKAIREVDPQQPVAAISSMAEVAASSLAPSRFFTLLLGLFAGLALVLAALGVYGVVSFAVNRQRREIGVRVALGADRGRVLGLVVGRAMAVVAVGLVAGVALALPLGRLLGRFLFEVSPQDPAALALAPAVLAAVALAASLGPGRRATRIDPVEALRQE